MKGPIGGGKLTDRTEKKRSVLLARAALYVPHRKGGGGSTMVLEKTRTTAFGGRILDVMVFEGELRESQKLKPNGEVHLHTPTPWGRRTR